MAAHRPIGSRCFVFVQDSFLYKQIIILSALIPITLLTFIYIPKINPRLNFNSRLLTETGLNNKLRPGDISSLIQNEQLVGRIFFETNMDAIRGPTIHKNSYFS